MLGCQAGDEDSLEQRVDRLVDEDVAEIQAQLDVLCECWQEYGYESRTSCENDAFVVGPSQVRCIKDAYAQDPDSAIDYLECVLPLKREYTACIDQRLECSDVLSEEPCFEDYSVGFDRCIGLPPTITRPLEACSE